MRIEHDLHVIRAKLLLVLVALLAIPAARAQNSGHASIAGRVVLGSQALEHSTVLLYRNGNPAPILRTATDKSGSFNFPNLPSGTYSVTVEPDHYKAKTLGPIQLTTGPSKPLIFGFAAQDSLIQPAPPCAACVTYVAGKVILGKEPLEDTDVLLYRAGNPKPVWQTATNELGSFSFKDLPSGTYSVKVDPENYKAKTAGPIQLTNEPSEPLVFKFGFQDSLFGAVAACAQCASQGPGQISNSKKELGDPVWNFWMESPPQTGQSGPQISYKAISLKTQSRAQLVIDLSAIAYDGFDKAVYSRSADSDFTRRLRAIPGDSISLDIIVNPDPLYFAIPHPQNISQPMHVDLKKLRASQTHGMAIFASPRYMLRFLGNASAEYSYGVTAFPIRTLGRQGWAPVNIEVWSHDTSTPLTEATAFFCVSGTADDDCGPRPAADATIDSLSGVDLAGRGKAPDAALQISERADGLVGVFKCNASFCPDHDYHTWEVGQGSAWLRIKLNTTLNLLASREAFAEAHPDQSNQLQSVYMAAGRAMFEDVFYSEQHDPGLQPVIADMQRLVVEGAQRQLRNAAPPTLFARIIPTSNQLLVVPWSLMVVPSAADATASAPLGATVEVESPLPLQSYLSPKACVSNWTLLVPPPRTPNPDDALSAVFSARDEVSSWIHRFSDFCHSCVEVDPSRFGSWLTSNTPASSSEGVVVLSHHSTDGQTDAYFMDVDADGNIGPATYANISRAFPDPSFAVLDACGTGKPASSEFVHQFNRAGVYTVISTAIDVDPVIAGKFLDLFMTHLSDSNTDNDHSIGRAKWLATRDLSKQYGSAAFVYSLSGNSAIKACVPLGTPLNTKNTP